MKKIRCVFYLVRHLFCAVFVVFAVIFSGDAFGAVCASGEYDDVGVCKTCDMGYYCVEDIKYQCESGKITAVSGASDVSQCENPEFVLTTTALNAGARIQFKMSAVGEFVVDWGDGTAPQTISRTNTKNETYSHTYTNAGTYVIGISGQATGYSTNEKDAAISFADNNLISGISGSLGAIFGTLTDGSQPRFIQTFRKCTNLSGEIPENIFDGIYGAPVSQMFKETFKECKALTGSIPGSLFADLSGTPAKDMFRSMFSDCSGLTGFIPPDLFAGFTYSKDALNQMFEKTGLSTSCPEGYTQYTTGFESDFGGFVSCKILCDSGYYLPAGDTVCEICLVNNYCVGGMFDFDENIAQGIVACPDNMVSSAGSVSLSGCKCPAGYYSNNGECTQCEAGYMCDGVVRGVAMYGGYAGGGQTGVSRCSNGQTTLNVGSTSVDDCVSCLNSDNVQSWAAASTSNVNIMNVCRIKECKEGYRHVEIIGGENLFDISQIPEKGDSGIISAGSIVRDGDVVIVSRTATNSAPGTGKTLRMLCPMCQIGKRYILNMTTTKANSNYMYIYKTGVIRGLWYNNATLQLTQDMLDAGVHLYDNGTYGSESNMISDIQIREYDDVCVPSTINVNWDADNGSESFTTQCTVNGDILLPMPPEKRGYTFTGWKLITVTE